MILHASMAYLLYGVQLVCHTQAATMDEDADSKHNEQQ
jgi:hypothetical protein